MFTLSSAAYDMMTIGIRNGTVYFRKGVIAHNRGTGKSSIACFHYCCMDFSVNSSYAYAGGQVSANNFQGTANMMVQLKQDFIGRGMLMCNMHARMICMRTCVNGSFYGSQGSRLALVVFLL